MALVRNLLSALFTAVGRSASEVLRRIVGDGLGAALRVPAPALARGEAADRALERRRRAAFGLHGGSRSPSRRG